MARDLRCNSSVKGLPSFVSLESHRQLYPYFWTTGPFHLNFKNEVPHTLSLSFGTVHSKCDKPPLDIKVWTVMYKLHMASRRFKPTSIAQSVRSLLRRGNWKAWEDRSFVCQELVHLVANPSISQQIIDFICLMTKVYRLLQAAVIDPGNCDNEPGTLDLTMICDDGLNSPHFPSSASSSASGL
jgi:hypothetical protein